jgi:hypothetical protein
VQRLAREAVTVDAVLTMYEAETKRNACTVHRGRVLALRAALGKMKLADLTRDHLDRLCDEWQATGVRYAERDVKLHRVRPITGATCNRFMAIFHRARELAMDKLGVDLPRLTFPRFTETAAGQYVSPADFFAILTHVAHPTKRAFMELLYLLAIRPGQLKSTETSNVRVERGLVVALVYPPHR